MKKIYALLMFFGCIAASYAQAPGAALDFDGNDDYVTIFQTPGSTISGNYTIEAWIQPKDGFKNMHIFSSRTPSEYGFDLQILNGNTIHADIGNGTGWLSTTANATYNYTPGTWFHVAYVVTTTGYTIYVNGNQLAAATYAGGANTPLLLNDTHALQFGHNGSDNTYYRGSMDDVKIYNTALTQANIQADMNNTTPSVPGSCVANYTFNTATANAHNEAYVTLINQAGGNYYGTLQSFYLQSAIGNWTTDRTATNLIVNGVGYYATLNDAFYAINIGAHTGAVSINVVGDTTENNGVALAANGANSGVTSYSSISITPTGARTITGTQNFYTVDLNGASHVTINGLNTAGNNLKIINPTISSATVVVNFRGEASDNMITNCTLVGASTASPVIYFNDNTNNNTISYCNIGGTAANPVKGCIALFANAFPTYASGILIDHNDFFDYFNTDNTTYGVEFDNGGFTVTNNKFYQTTARTLNSGGHGAIRAGGSSLASTNISNNIIGYANSDGTGIYTVSMPNNGIFTGITATNNFGSFSIQNNTIAGIAISGQGRGFTGIDIQKGPFTVSGNTIGSMNATGNITFNTTFSTDASVTGISTSLDGDYTINNNNIGGITASGPAVSVYGISIAHAADNAGICNGNIIGGTVSNSLQSISAAETARVIGIYGNAFMATVNGNTVRNLTSGGSDLSGINLLTINLLDIEKNNIYDINSTHSTDALQLNGISASALSSTAAATIAGNTIHALVGASDNAASFINGIATSGTMASHVYNNMVTLGNTVTKGMTIRGIYENVQVACEYYNNSVFIGGSPTTGSGLSSALTATTANTGLRYFNNNILVNNRSNNGATGNNICVSLFVNIRTNADNNIYCGNGNGFYLGYDNNHAAYIPDLAQWKTANNTDGGSFFGNPQYMDPSGMMPDLHINPSVQTIIESRGSVFNGLATDFDNETRSGLTPSDIGADAGNFIALPSPAITSLGNTSVCVGGSLDINGAGFATTTLVKIGTATVTVTNITDTVLTVTVPSGATGTVTVTTSVGSVVSSQSVISYLPLTINTQPVAPATYCAETGTTTISVLAANATGYIWRKNGTPLTNVAPYSNVTTNTLTITDPPYSENNAVFDVEVSNPGCGTLTSVPVTLTLIPTPLTAVNTSATNVCPGNSATLMASGATTYSWSPATGLSATTGAIVTATPAATTIYTVTGTNGNGCFSAATVTVIVNNPAVTLTAGTSNICPGGTTSITASGAGAYVWSPSSGLSATTGTVITASPAQTTTYTVVGTDANGCTASKTITIAVKPAQEIAAYGATTFCSDSNVVLGVKNKALQFNGTNNYMAINRSVADDFTIEYWIKTTQPNAAGTDWYSGKGIIDGEIAGNANDFGTSLMNSKIAFGIGGGGTFTDKTIQSTTSVNTGQWFHVALTRSKSDGAIKIYINGVLETSDVSPNTASLTSASGFRIGSTFNGTNYFNGSLDEIRIWNVVRTQSEIQTSMGTDFSSGASGLLDYFKMNQRTGAIADNIVNAANNGTLFNGPTWVNFESISAYLWSNGATTPEITVNTMGSYSLQSTDSDSCIRTSSSISTTVSPSSTVAISPSSATACLGIGTTLTASGGVSYSWSPATGLDNTNTAVVIASPVVTTTYTVTATAANGCQASQSVTITINSPTVTASAANEVICAGSSTTLTASGAQSYVWSPSTGLNAVTGTSVTANPTITTTYTVIGTDAVGCSKSATVIVVVKPLAVITTSGPTAFCQGGSVALSATIPVAGLQFNGTSNVVNANRNVANDFTIEFWMKTTQNPFESSLWYGGKGLVTAYTSPVANTFGVTLNANLLDFGVGNTEIRSTSSVNTGQWIHVAVTRTKANGAMAIYINGILEKTGTSNTASLTQQSILSLGKVSTSGYFSGSLDDVRIWNTVRTQAQIAAGMNATFPAGTPNLVDYFKLDETTGTIAQNTANVSNIGTLANVQTWVTSGRNYQTYLWSNGETTPSITATTADNYSVQVTNTDGCASTSEVVPVTVNPLPVAGITPASPTVCLGSNVILTASGGATYSWSPATELSATTGASVTVTPTATRTYTVTITSANGCVSTQTVTVAVNNPAIIVSAADTAICAGGSTTLTASGMLTYSWSPSTGLNDTTGISVTANPTETTTYTVTGTDAGGCSKSASVTVIVKATPVITAGGPTTFCPGGSVVLSSAIPVKGLQFNGTNTSVTTGPKNVADNFTLEFWMKTTQTTGAATRWLNGKGLVAAYSGNAGDFGTSMASNKFVFGYGNASSSTVLTVRSTSNVNTGNWVHVAAVRNKTAGNVQIYINGVLEASQTTSTSTLGANTAPVVLGMLGNTVGSNFNGSLDEVRIWNVARTQTEIQAGMNASYPAGTPNLIDYFKLDETSGTTAANTANAANNGTLVNSPAWMDSSKNYASYLWSNGAVTPTIAATASGNYTVQTTNTDNCIATSLPVTVIVNAAAPITAVATDPIICFGGSTQLTASGGVSYVWSPSSGLSDVTGTTVTATPSATTTYTVTGTDASGCMGTQTITVTVNHPEITVTGTTAFCAGSNTTLTASGALSYTWSPADGLDTTTGNMVTANPSETTTYTVSGNSASGCPMSTTITITVNPLPTIALTPTSNEICFGTGTSIQASGAATYTWSPATGLDTTTGSNVMASPLTDTTYTVTGIDSNGCSNTATVSITVKNAPVITADTASGIICSGGSAILTADGGDDYSWSPADGLSATTGDTVTASPTVTTIYTVTGIRNGCSSTAQVTVNVTVVPVMVSAAQLNINPGGSTLITASGGESYSWSPATGLNAVTGVSVTASPTATTTYTVTATDANGCTSSQTITITVKANAALDFDGFDDYIAVPAQAETVSGSFTVEAWVKPMHPDKWMHIFSTRGGNDVSFDVQMGAGNTLHGDIGNGSNWIRTDANANFNYTVGEWLHVAFVVTNTDYKIYANGCEVGSGGYGFDNPLLLDPNHFISIGNSATEDTFFQGSIDAVKVYRSALSQPDIQADMASTSPVHPENIVAFYSFNEGNPGDDNTALTTLIDQHDPSVYNGMLNNFTLTGDSGNWVAGADASNVACSAPFNLGNGEITGTSAVLHWDNAGCLPVTNDVHVITAGGGIPTGTPSDPDVTSPFTKTNLTGGNYEFYVRSNCNAGNASDWSGPYPFTVYAVADVTAIALPNAITTEISQPFTLRGQLQENGLTDVIPNIDGETPGIEFWIGMNTNNTAPSTWDNAVWQPATWDGSVSASYEQYTLQTSLSIAETRYFATRARIGGSNASYTYGGSNGIEGGNWDGITYGNGTIAITLENDECAAAQQILLNTITNATNSSATESTALHASCATGSYDTWFAFNSGNYQSLTLSVAPASPGTTVGFAVYSGDCNNLTEIFCSNGPKLQMSSLSNNTTYYIRVFSAQPSETGSFNIYIYQGADLTAIALPDIINAGLGESVTLRGQLQLAGLTDVVPNIDGQSPEIEYWIGTNTSNTDPSTWPEDMWQPAGWDAAVSANYEEYTLQYASAVPATKYFATRARIGGANSVYTYGGSDGTQGGNWDGSTFVNGTITTSIVNDECYGAIPVTIGANNYNDNNFSTPSALPISCANGTVYDTWYSFNTGNYNGMDISIFAGNVGHDFGYAVYSGDCGTLTEMYCETTTANATTAVLMPNTTYYIRVFSDAANIGAFYVNVAPPPCSITALVNGDANGYSYICPGGSTTLTATGGSTYSWSPATGLDTTTGATVIASPSVSTTYTVTVSENGCDKTANHSVYIYNVAAIVVYPETPSMTEGTSVTLTAYYGSDYVWSPATGLNTTTGNTVIASPETTTTYTVTSTNGNGCTTTKSVTVTVNPPGDNALSFDGTDDHVSVPAYAATISGSYTVEAWVNPYDTKNMHLFSTREGNDFTFDMVLKSNGSIHADIGNGTAWLTTVADAPINYSASVWMHIAYVVTPSGYTIYMNGCLAGSGTFSGAPLLLDGSHNISIGKNGTENTFFFGIMDNLKVYNTALSQANIAADMTSSTPVIPGSLVALYDFNKGNPTFNNAGITTLPDNSVGAHYNGTLNNFQLNGYIGNWVTGQAAQTGSCTPANGISARQISQGTALIKWNVDCNAVSYDVHVTTFNGGLPSGVPSNPNTATPLTVSGLPLGYSSYYVRANCSEGEGIWQGPFSILIRPMASLTTVEGPNVMNVYTTQPFTLKGHVQVDGLTDVGPNVSGQAPDIEFWIGTSASNIDPSGWGPTSWVLADYNPGVNAAYDEYTIQKTLPTPQTLYFASRARISGSSSPYTYGGVSATQGGTWDSVAYVNGKIIATNEPPANDYFDNAIPLSCGASVSGNTTNATNDQPNPSVFGVLNSLSRNVWYSYTGSGTPQLITVSLCNSAFDTGLLVATGTSGSLTYITGNDNFCGTSGSRSQVTFNSDGVTTYRIMVRGWGVNTFGAYTLDLTCAAACSPVTANDECTTAQVATNILINGNNYCATPSDMPAPSCAGAPNSIYYDSWYSFNTGSATAASITITQSAPTVVSYAVYSGTCGNLTLKSCMVGASTLFSGLTVNTVYYVRVYSLTPQTRGNFTLMVAPINCTTLSTWNGSAWSNGTPSSTKAAVMSGNYTANADLTACTLIVNNNAAVTVNPGFDFNVNGMVTVTPGASLTFENNANLLQTTAATVNYNSGNITVKRNASMRRLDYVYWGSPVAAQNLQAFSPQTISNRFYTLDEPTNSFVNIPDPSVVDFVAPKGYMVRAPNTFPPDGSVAVFNGIFNGVPNNGTYTTPITFTDAQKGFNMLGNPYPSPISANTFLASNPGTLYFWTHFSQTAATGTNYATYNTTGHVAAAGGAIPNGSIQTGQGFLLKTATANGTATFTNAMRTGNNTGQFFRDANIERHRIWINLSNAEVPIFNQMLVGYLDGATAGFDDGIDGPLNYIGTSISSIINNEVEVYGIQGRSLPFENTDVVPLNFKAVTAGSYTLAIDHVDGLFAEDQPVFLKDNLTGTVHDIKASPYDFASAEGSFANRFEIVYQNATLGVAPILNPDSIILYKENGIFKINSGKTIMKNVKVFDVRGRLIYEQNDINATATALTGLRAEQEVLLVQITSDQNEVITKKAVY